MRSQAALLRPPATAERADTAGRAPMAAPARERFERLLREKSRAAEQDDAPGDPPPRDTGEAMVVAPLPEQPGESLPDAGAVAVAPSPTPSRCAVGPDVPQRAPGPEPLPSVTVAALHAAAKADVSPPSLAAYADGEAATWEISVHEPLGVPLELRAVRVPPSAAAGPAATPWQLTIASPGLDRAVLARHASRLEARLRGVRHGAVELHLDDAERGDDADADA